MTYNENEFHTFKVQAIQLSNQTRSLAMALAPNTVQVWPGGAVFSSIQAAIDSITDANAQEQYQIAVGIGTFNENVQMKDYVYVIGSGQDKTIITAPPQQIINGVVNSATGAGIAELTINAPGGVWGSWAVGIKIAGAGNFHISGVTFNIGAGSTGDNVRGITNNTGSQICDLNIEQCIFNLSGDSNSTCTGLSLFGNGAVAFVNLTAMQINGKAQNFGISTAVQASVTVDDSKITANTFTLYNSDGVSPITANQCSLDGPVSGAVVNN